MTLSDILFLLVGSHDSYVVSSILNCSHTMAIVTSIKQKDYDDLYFFGHFKSLTYVKDLVTGIRPTTEWT